MKLFIDTAFPEDVASVASWGVLSGVTTNPSLAAQTGRPYHEVVQKICALVPNKCVSAQVTSETADDMITEGEEIAKWHKQVVVKLPLTPAGLEACAALTAKGIQTNVTLCFSAQQALLAARAGATYVSPFIGRLEDKGEDGIELIADIADIFAIHGISTEIIAASIRNEEHIKQAALAGAHISTIPPKLFKEMVSHDLTDAGLKKFMDDWKASKSAA